MSMWDRVRKLMNRAMDRAKEGAADVAQVANLKLDIRGLEGRRDHLLREMGQKVFAMHGEGRGLAGLKTECEEIAQVERQIRTKETELQGMKDRPPAAAEEPKETAAG